MLARALLLLVLSPLVGCQKTTDDARFERGHTRSASEMLAGFVIGQVTTRQTLRAEQPIDGIDGAEVGRAFRTAVRDLPMFRDEGGPGPVITFELEFGVGLGLSDPPPRGSGLGTAEGTGSGAYVVVALSANGGAARDPRYQFEVQGLYRARIRGSETALEAGHRLVGEGIADLVDGIRAEAAPRVAESEDLLALLDDTESEARLAVVREIHRRRYEPAAEPLRAHLSSPDLELVIASASALGRLQDPEAVGPLINLISREHRELTELVLPILGEIGSLEARSYLETVADAHERGRIRELARQVLEQSRGLR